MDKLGDIMMVKFEIGKMKKMFNVPKISCHEVVHSDDMKALINKMVAKMRS